MFPNPPTNSPWGPNPPWAPGGPDWLWFATAGLLALVVLVLLYVAVWRGRSRGRLRCPKCWYNMAGAEGVGAEFPLTCPECGKAIRTPRHLRKTRVRWRVVGVCAALALLATASALLPRVRTLGPMSVLPTRMLIHLDTRDLVLRRNITYEESFNVESPEISSILSTLQRGRPSGAAKFARQELNRRNATHSFSRREWRACIRRLRVLTPSTTLIEHEGETRPAYARFSSYNPSMVRGYMLHAEVAELHRRSNSDQIATDPPEGPDRWSTNEWLTEGVVLAFQPFGPPLPVSPYGGHYHVIPLGVHAITYRLTVRQSPYPFAAKEDLGPPIELGEMTVEIPIEFRDQSTWRERFPEAYADE